MKIQTNKQTNSTIAQKCIYSTMLNIAVFITHRDRCWKYKHARERIFSCLSQQRAELSR